MKLFILKELGLNNIKKKKILFYSIKQIKTREFIF